jgi:hypothetical protein
MVRTSLAGRLLGTFGGTTKGERLMRERWGSFSVADHNATEKLVTDVLTYDRLVFPFPPDDAERGRWGSHGWNPDLLAERFEQLGDRAVKVPWDEYRREQFAKNMQRASAVAADAETTIPDSAAFQMTRRILAQCDPLVLPRGVSKAIVVAAYHSFEDLKTDCILDGEQSDPKLLSILVRNRIAQPRFSRDPEKSLALAIQLSRDTEFQEKRRDLYRWQEDVLAAGVPAGRAMEEIEDLINRYNALVIKANRKVTYRLVFTVVTVGLALTGALLANPIASIPFSLAAASSGLSLARFATLERSPVVTPGETAPAAMFHEVESKM